MKRLIKKSQIYTGFSIEDDDDNYYEVFQNPTSKEIESIKKNNKYNAIRGVIFNSNNWYIWDGNICHNEIDNYLRNKVNALDPSGFRFAWEPNAWIIDSWQSYTKDEGIKLINKYKDILNQIGNVYCEFQFIDLKGNPRNYDYYITQEEPIEQIACKSRLAKVYDGFQEDEWYEQYFEVFVNPTDSEIEEVKKSSPRHAIRGVIENDETIYIWPGDFVHSDINSRIEGSIDVDISFRFAYDSGAWIFDANHIFSLEEMENMIYKYQDTLSKFGNIHQNLWIGFTSDNKKVDISIDEINEKHQKVAKLL